MHWEYLLVDGLSLLVGCSPEEGAVVVEWDPDVVTGLGGAAAVVSDPGDSHVYVAGALNASLAHVTRGDELDGLGGRVRSLSWVQAWSDGPLAVSRVRKST